MIHSSILLRRALLADTVFSGVGALAMTLDANLFAPLLQLPEALLRETGLFLIAYTALVGWLGTRPAVPKALVILVIAGNALWTLASIGAPVLWRGQSEPIRPNRGRGPGDRHRHFRRAAIHRSAAEPQRAGRRLKPSRTHSPLRANAKQSSIETLDCFVRCSSR